MKPRRTMFIALGIAGIAGVSLLWEPLWTAVVYRQEWNDGGHFVHLVKRASWLPGKPTIFPDQVCEACDHGQCWKCYEKDPIFDVGTPVVFHCRLCRQKVEIPDTWNCPCFHCGEADFQVEEEQP